ncbi:MAG: hypothetical protein R6V28_02035 [Nitriliruptoraceae bacterium]
MVGITERAVQTILRDLEAGGYISRRRVGRRNRYDVHPDLPMRHPVESGHHVAEILRVLVASSDAPGAPDAGGEHQPGGPHTGVEPDATGGRPDGPA